MKKTLCVLLSVLIIASLFCACSSKKDEKDNTETAEYTLKITNDSHYDAIDESSKRTYVKLANAIINGDSSLLFNLQMLDSVNQLIYTSFPLISLVKSIDVNDDKTGVNIIYNNDLETHKKLVKEFTEKVSSIMKECKYGQVSNNVYLLNVYTYVASHITYDNNSITVYDAIINSKGMSASISGMFEYLLLQGSVKAMHVYSVDAANNSWFWTQAYIGNSLYNFDVASEISGGDGKGLSSFAMTDKEMINSGVKKGFSHTDKAETTKCDDTHYSSLRSCFEYTVSGNTIKAKNLSGDTIDVELS